MALVGAIVLVTAAPAAAQAETVDGVCEIRSTEADVVAEEAAVTLTNTRVEAVISEEAIVRWHDVGLLEAGENLVPGSIVTTVAATGVLEGSQTTDAVEFAATTTVNDPDGRPATADETATPMVVTADLPDTTWTPSGTAQGFSIVGSDLRLRLFFGVISVDVACSPGALPAQFASTGAPTDPPPLVEGVIYNVPPLWLPISGYADLTTTTTAPTSTTTATDPTTTDPTTTPSGPSGPLPHTGPALTIVLVIGGLLLLDLGYFSLSATRGE